MKLKYAQIRGGNFGDDLNPWLWPQCAPELFDDNDSILFLGIGTILHRRHPAQSLKVVFSSGAGYRRPPVIDDSWKVYCVRGKLTAQQLGLSPQLAVGDGAYLIRQLGLFERVSAGKRVGFMPHHASLNYLDWRKLCDLAGVLYLDPGAPVEQTLQQMASCEVVLAEAMHAAIVADVLRIPWVAVRHSHRILESKWKDWLSAFDLDVDFHDMPPVLQAALPLKEYAKRRMRSPFANLPFTPDRWKRMPYRQSTSGEFEKSAQWLGNLAKTASPQLTSESALARVEERLGSKLELLRSDFAKGLLVPPHKG